MLANDSFHIAVLPGDGIGPEVMAPALAVLDKVAAATPGLKFRFTEAPAGAGHYRDTGTSMPASTIKLCEEADATPHAVATAGSGASRFRSSPAGTFLCLTARVIIFVLVTI